MSKVIKTAAVVSVIGFGLAVVGSFGLGDVTTGMVTAVLVGLWGGAFLCENKSK